MSKKVYYVNISEISHAIIEGTNLRVAHNNGDVTFYTDDIAEQIWRKILKCNDRGSEVFWQSKKD